MILSAPFLYAPGAFFFYPHKLLFLYLVGDTYEIGYKHFRRDHSKRLKYVFFLRFEKKNARTNVTLSKHSLLLHIIALVWQLVGNFGVLNEIDNMMAGTNRTFSFVSALLWISILTFSPAPKIVSLCSVVSIVAAFYTAPYIKPRDLEISMMLVFSLVLFVATIMSPSKTRMKDLIRGIGYFIFAVSVRIAVASSNISTDMLRSPEIVLFCIMCAVSMLPKPVKPIVVTGLILIRVLGELTESYLCLYLGAAFCAQLAQGIAHDFTKQKATLMMNEDSGVTRSKRLAFDWSHCVYFPNLLFQSCYQSLRLSRKFS